MFRRLRKPTRPMPNSAAPTKQRVVQQSDFVVGIHRSASSCSRTRSSRSVPVERTKPGCSSVGLRNLPLCADDGRRADQRHQQQRAGHFDRDQVAAEQFGAQVGDVLGSSTFGRERLLASALAA